MSKVKKRDAVPAIRRFTIGGQEVAEIPADRIVVNPWNPNKMSEETFAKEKASITEFGMVVPLLVRFLAAKNIWEIIDGEHRYRACLDLGFTHLLVVDLGEISDQKAKKLTIIANDLRGKSDPGDLAKLIANLAERENPEELAKLLPQSQVELESMIASLQPYDLPSSAPGPEASGDLSLAPAPSLAGLGKDIRVQFGAVKGTVPEAIFQKFMEEYTNSVQYLGTKNVELVVQDLAQRLAEARRPARVAAADKAVGPAKAETAS